LQHHPLGALPIEDLDIVVQFVLHSGSLKDLAIEYGVSYPTIRVRLDRTIERLKSVLAGQTLDPVQEMLAAMVERGEISVGSARALRDAIREQSRAGAGGAGAPRGET
jgi:hypothetical protein